MIIHESASTKSGEHQIDLSAFRLLQLRITAYRKFVFAHCFSFNFPFKQSEKRFKRKTFVIKKSAWKILVVFRIAKKYLSVQRKRSDLLIIQTES